MRLKCLCKILTLVLVGQPVLAMPSSPAPPKTPRPEALRESPSLAALYPTRVIRPHSFIVSLGAAHGALEDRQARTLALLSLALQKDLGDESAQAFGLAVSTGALWGLHWEQRDYCCLGEWSEAYWSYGIGSFYKSSEQLASLVNIDRYHLRLGAGFEDLGGWGRRLRLEALMRLSPLGASAELNLGWTWDWTGIGLR